MGNNAISVLITRPDPQGSVLCERIRERGDNAIHFPTIEIIAPDNQALMLEKITTIGEQDWLIFISPQAVFSSIPYIRQAWPIMGDTVNFAAIGAGTAQALHEAGYQNVVHPLTDWNSEELLKLPEFQAINEKKIAVIRGENGRDLLEKSLVERGAFVTPIVCYRRALPNIHLQKYTEFLINVIVCTSYDSIKNLKILVGEMGWKSLKQTPCVVVSDRIKKLAHDLGFQTIWVAKNASHEAILKMLAQKRNEICQIKPMKL
ncbi:MAG: Uroporphyrinogen-III synthase [uncultured bacterium]|nr:MAG: Uroporphyrinogen-III synthase [uncultured bacterium]